MPEPIDTKYKFIAVSNEHGTEHNEYDAIVFLAKDKALHETLIFYYVICVKLGAQTEQLESIRRMIHRVEVYQNLNPNKVKVADIDVSLLKQDKQG